MAIVYLARDVRHGRMVAIKVLNPELAEALGTERFLREIKTAANLTHPHILPVHDSGSAGGELFYVMPFVEGQSLRDRLRREKQLPVAEAVRIVVDVAQALDYAHRHDVVHRDIKPENILLQGDHAFVVDFGIAGVIADPPGGLTQTGVGTWHDCLYEPRAGLRGTDRWAERFVFSRLRAVRGARGRTAFQRSVGAGGAHPALHHAGSAGSRTPAERAASSTKRSQLRFR